MIHALIDLVERGQKLEDVLSEYGMMASPQHNQYKGSGVLIIYTDLEADDIFAITCLIHKRMDQGLLGYPPIIVFTTDPLEDTHAVYARKLVMAASALGPDVFLNIRVVSGDNLPDPFPPYNMTSRDEVLHDAANEIRTGVESVHPQSTCTVEWFILAPGRGNIRRLLGDLSKDWHKNIVLKERSKVHMYSSQFNITGMTDGDIQSITELVKESKR